jgi:hypothetical protein
MAERKFTEFNTIPLETRFTELRYHSRDYFDTQKSELAREHAGTLARRYAKSILVTGPLEDVRTLYALTANQDPEEAQHVLEMFVKAKILRAGEIKQHLGLDATSKNRIIFHPR